MCGGISHILGVYLFCIFLEKLILSEKENAEKVKNMTEGENTKG